MRINLYFQNKILLKNLLRVNKLVTLASKLRLCVAPIIHNDLMKKILAASGNENPHLISIYHDTASAIHSY